MPQEIQAIRFDVEDIGKHVKSSKKKFSWVFALNGRNHTIVLDFSFISGKVKLTVDRNDLLNTELPASSSFQHPFTLDGYALNILQQGEAFQLRINNKVFSHLYNQAKTNTEFKNYEDQVKDIKVDEGSFQNNSKTIKLNIGALEGGKKRAKNTNQSQNWGNFGGEIGIPSYFGEGSSQSTSSSTSQKKQTQVKQNLLDDDDQVKMTKPKVESQRVAEIDFFANSSQTSSPTSPSEQHLQQIVQEQAQSRQQFNTMQNMFATMNIQQKKPEVTLGNPLDLLSSSTVQAPVVSLNVNKTQQFSTMQNLFATSMPGQLPAAVNYPTAQGTAKNTAVDFNTMQNMFATNLNGGSIGATFVPPKPMETFATNQAANVPNPGNFNTMQNLFATNAQGMPVAANFGTVKVSELTPSLAPNPTETSFNTMQNMFATTKIQPGLENTGNPGVQSLAPNVADFSTMQNLFATGQVVFTPPTNPTTMQAPSFNTSSITAVTPGKTAELNTSFNTMQNMFATGAPGPIPQNLNPVDFNTMQNMFATQNLGGKPVAPPALGTPSEYNTMQNLFATQNATGTVQAQSLPQSNLSDFNTMQNLFNSSSGMTFPPPAPQTTSTATFTIAQISKSSQSFAKPDAIFNTYSGPKTSNEAPSFDMSAFGTMQKGQTAAFDFTQATSTQPASGVPNFSKKKQAEPSDLI